MSTPNEIAESSDLDDLLDEAMDIVNDQERKHEEQVKIRDAELNDKINAALEEKSNNSENQDAEVVLASLMKLIGALKVNDNKEGGNDEIDDESLNKLKGDIDSVIAQMESSDLLTAEDRQSLHQVQNLISIADDDPSKIDEFLSAIDPHTANNNSSNNSNNRVVAEGNGVDTSELQKILSTIANFQSGNANAVANDKDNESNSTNGNTVNVNQVSTVTLASPISATTTTTIPPLPETPFVANKEETNNTDALSQGLQQFLSLSTNNASKSVVPTSDNNKNIKNSSQEFNNASNSNTSTTNTTVSTSTTTEPTNNLSSSATNQLANMLVNTFCDPQFVEPIRIMRDAYDGWLRDHEASLSAEDKRRYEKQYAKTKEICDFFDVPLTADSDERVIELMELMGQFSELGNPPDDLCNYNTVNQS